MMKVNCFQTKQGANSKVNFFSQQANNSNIQMKYSQSSFKIDSIKPTVFEKFKVDTSQSVLLENNKILNQTQSHQNFKQIQSPGLPNCQFKKSQQEAFLTLGQMNLSESPPTFASINSNEIRKYLSSENMSDETNQNKQIYYYEPLYCEDIIEEKENEQQQESPQLKKIQKPINQGIALHSFNPQQFHQLIKKTNIKNEIEKNIDLKQEESPPEPQYLNLSMYKKDENTQKKDQFNFSILQMNQSQQKKSGYESSFRQNDDSQVLEECNVNSFKLSTFLKPKINLTNNQNSILNRTVNPRSQYIKLKNLEESIVNNQKPVRQLDQQQELSLSNIKLPHQNTTISSKDEIKLSLFQACNSLTKRENHMFNAKNQLENELLPIDFSKKRKNVEKMKKTHSISLINLKKKSLNMTLKMK